MDIPESPKVEKSSADFFEKTDTAKTPANAPAVPKLCDLTIELQKLSLIEEKITKRIWGRIQEWGKLHMVEGDWALDCTISDGTESLEVKVAPMLLEKEIGYSYVEFMVMKKLRKTNPNIGPKLRMALRKADNKFRNANALDVEFSIDTAPKLVNITKIPHAEEETMMELS